MCRRQRRAGLSVRRHPAADPCPRSPGPPARSTRDSAAWCLGLRASSKTTKDGGGLYGLGERRRSRYTTRVRRAWKRSISATTVADADVGSVGYVIRLPWLQRRKRRRADGWTDRPATRQSRPAGGRKLTKRRGVSIIARRGEAPTTGRKGQLYRHFLSVARRGRSPLSIRFWRWPLLSRRTALKMPWSDSIADCGAQTAIITTAKLLIFIYHSPLHGSNNMRKEK